ncbi:MAG: hypothetical protein US70_C0002G0023 [Parcubacteria group bacterium GW2011_GWD2_38_11]|nr:MAG: hypothetical protein US70_C0002G0023 [Parcubacteria group bacterium GW2011_GWD2_38_11]
MLKEKWSKIRILVISHTVKIYFQVFSEIKSWEIKKMTPKKVLNIVIFLVALTMGIYFQWGIMNTLIFFVLIGIILRPVRSQILAFPALFFLVLTPFALILKFEAVAENLAIYAYYFLVLTVIMGIYELRSEKA